MDRRSSLKKMFAAMFGGVAALVLPKKALAVGVESGRWCAPSQEKPNWRYNSLAWFSQPLQVLKLEPLRCRAIFKHDERDDCIRLLKTLSSEVYSDGLLKCYSGLWNKDHIVVEWEHKLT